MSIFSSLNRISYVGNDDERVKAGQKLNMLLFSVLTPFNWQADSNVLPWLPNIIFFAYLQSAIASQWVGPLHAGTTNKKHECSFNGTYLNINDSIIIPEFQ